MQRVQDLFRLLPGVAFRIVELLCPFFSVVEAPMKTFAGSGMARMATHMLMLRGRLGRGLHPCDAGVRGGPGQCKRADNWRELDVQVADVHLASRLFLFVC